MRQFWRRVSNVFQEEAMRMKVSVNRNVCKAVRDVETHNQGLNDEKRSNVSKAVVIVVLVVDAACGKPAIEVAPRAEDVRGYNEPMTQMCMPARAPEVTEEGY